MKRSTEINATSRRYDLDALRGIGAILVVIAHCATTFSPWVASMNINPAFANLQTNKLFSEFLWVLNLWLMPLFMLLAGASAWYALRKRTNRQYLSERLIHLGVPLLLLTTLFAIPGGYIMRVSAGEYSGSFLNYLLHFFDAVYPEGNFNLFHLWFLLYLLLYVVLTLPLFRFLSSNMGKQLVGRFADACSHPGGILLPALPLLVVQLALSGITPPSGINAVVNDWMRLISLLLVFILGYVLLADPKFQQAIARQWVLASGVAFATTAISMAWVWPDSFNAYRDLPVDYSWGYMAFWSVYAITSWAWLVALLGFGQRFLNTSHALIRWASQASFPVYLFHPMLWIPGTFIVSQWIMPSLVAFLLLVAMVLPGTYLLVTLLGRVRVVGMLLGQHQPAHRQASSNGQNPQLVFSSAR